MEFNVNGSQISSDTKGIMQNTESTIATAAVSRLRVGLFPLSGSAKPDQGQYVIRVYGSDDTLLHTFHDAVLPNGEVFRLRAGSDNGESAPSIVVTGTTGNESMNFNTGTVDETPSTLPAEWMTLRLEVTVSGNIKDRNFELAAAPAGSPVMYSSVIQGAGQARFTIPVTVTL